MEKILDRMKKLRQKTQELALDGTQCDRGGNQRKQRVNHSSILRQELALSRVGAENLVSRAATPPDGLNSFSAARDTMALFEARGQTMAMDPDIKAAHDLLDAAGVAANDSLSARLVWVAERWLATAYHPGSCACVQCRASRRMLAVWSSKLVK